MTPQQLQQTAVFLRERYRPPHAAMSVEDGLVHTVMQALSRALDQTAEALPEIEEPRIDEPQAEAPGPSEGHLREVALDFSLRAQRGVEEGAVIVARAEILLAFLRGNPPSRASQEDAAWKAGER